MSAPSRASRGGTSAPRGTGTMIRGNRGSNRGAVSRGGRGASNNGTGSIQNPKAEGLLQGLKAGRGRRGAGRDQSMSRGHSSTFRRTGNRGSSQQTSRASSPKPPPTSANDYMNQTVEKYNLLKTKREQERAKAIRDGFLADPEKKTTLDQAITPVGTCTEMCPEFERVQRIVQNAVDRTEKVYSDALGRDMPVEERMVKRFRRSAAGDDEQLPSDIRTPATLKRSLDYLINDIVGDGENLATVHKFVWDRTRSIRNDFSIQQVSKPDDVRLAVECFERIARFHILSLHQLSNPDNLGGGNFDAHQEREQLNNTLLSLMYYYDDYRDRQEFKNEPEFRAYCIILEMQATHPDLEDRMQAWPTQLLQSGPVRNAFELHAAASNTLLDQGPLKPTTPFLIAQSNYEGFWKRMKSLQVSYLMACLAESHFGQIRYMALQNIWKSNKTASANQQKQNRQWNLDELTRALAFDDYEQTREFCESFELGFKADDGELEYLDFSSLGSNTLSPSSAINRQVFSHDVVEKKRYWRIFSAVINGMSVAEAIREGFIETGSEGEPEDELGDGTDGEDSLFVPEKPTSTESAATKSTSLFNPAAAAFKPTGSSTSTTGIFGQPTGSQTTPSLFGQPSNSQAASGTIFGHPSGAQRSSGTIFGQPTTSSTASTTNFGQQSNPEATKSTSIFGQTGASQITPSNSIFGKPTTSTTSQPTTSNSVFGQPAASTTPSNSVFGPSAQSTTPSSSIFGKPDGSQQTNPGIFGQPIKPKSEASNAFEKSAEGTQKPSISWGIGSSNLSNQSATPSTALPSSSVRTTFGQPSDPPTLAADSSSSQAEPPTKPQLFAPPPTSASPGGNATPLLFQPVAPLSQPEVLQPPPSPKPKHLELPDQKKSDTPLFTAQPPLANSASFHTAAGSSFTVSPSEKPKTTSQPSTFQQVPTAPATSLGSNQTTTPLFSGFTPTPADSTAKQIFELPKESVPGSAPAQQAPVSFTPSKSAIPPSFTPAERPPSRFNLAPPLRHSSPLSQPPVFAESSAGSNSIAAKPATRTLNKVEKGQLVEKISRLAMTEPGGLMQQFIEYKAIKILEAAVQQFQHEEEEKEIVQARYHLLASKFGRRWKEIAYKRVLNRKAKLRRSIFAEANRKETIKKRRGDEELEAILQAQREKDQIQRAQQRESLEHSVPNSPSALATVAPFESVTAVAGRKRKGVQRDNFDESISGKGPPTTNGHKRSRTAGTQDEIPTFGGSLQQAAPRDSPNRLLSTSVWSGKSVLLDYPDSPEIQAAARHRKVDRTHTDYFRLKAMGIDPETTAVPHTKESLDRKRQRQEDEGEDEASLTWTERRKRAVSMTGKLNPLLAKVLSSRTSLSPSSSPVMRSPSISKSPIPIASQTHILPHPATTKTSVVDDDDDDDELLRQVREVRSALSQDTQWFVEETEKLEEQERRSSDFGSSIGHQQSPPAPAFSESIGSSRVNGHEFTPSNSGIFTRSEQRLRRTGGSGLATRPVEDYLPGGSRYMPAMSKRSAAAYQGSASASPDDIPAMQNVTRKKGKRKVVDPTYQYESDQDDDDELLTVPRNNSKRKAVTHQQVDVGGHDQYFDEYQEEDAPGEEISEQQYEYESPEVYQNGQVTIAEETNQYANEATDSYQNEEEYPEEYDEAEEEEGSQEQEDNAEEYYEEDNQYADGEDEYEEEEEEGGEDDDEESPYQGEYGATPDDSSFARPGLSRSVSQGYSMSVTGTGASQDDALVLSD